MTHPSSVPPELHARITRWQRQLNPPSLVTQGYGPNNIKLRASARRSGLAEISGNARRKRKREDSMDAEPEKEKDKEVKRRPGRPRKKKDDQDQWQTSVPLRSEEKGRNGVGSDMASETQRGRSVGASSRKRGVKYIDQARSEATIDLPYLATCDPPVRPVDLTRMMQRDKKIPEPTLKLFRALRSVPQGTIPSELKVTYAQERDTPRKSNIALDDTAFLRPSQARYPASSIPMLKQTVDLVLRNGAVNQKTGAHERQWGALTHLLLCQAEYWYDEIRVLNVETVAIQPGEMRPRRPGNGMPIILDEIASKSEGATSANVTEYGDAMAKMVDWSVAIELDDDDEILLTSAYANLPDNLMSINQTLSYTRNFPLIFDLEVKKTVQPRDPVVQIAIWASAALLKKRQHGWDTSMPSPAITVDGHTWKYYIFFELDAELKMAGPFDFGSTATIHGIWDILHRLHILVEWGRTDYRKWIDDHVLAWARKISQPEKVSTGD